MPSGEKSTECQFRNLFLIGYRGTGKSTVARILADRLGWRFVDADSLLEERFGKTISEIFASEGETGFRDKESAIIAELCKGKSQIVATGGGVVLGAENRARIKSSGRVVLLTADVDTIFNRCQADTITSRCRPQLTVGGREEIEQLLAVREPFYRECANQIVDTVGKSSGEVADEVSRGLAHAS